MRRFYQIIIAAVFVMITSQFFGQSMAEDIVVPSAADAGRFGLDRQNIAPAIPNQDSSIKTQESEINIPDETKDIKFVLNRIDIEGVTIFTPEDLESLYKEHLNQEISLYVVWKIAERITKYYQDRGYFIVRAIVPTQEISSRGIIKIKVIEGFVAKLDFDEGLVANPIFIKLAQSLESKKPINIKTLESVMLQLNDSPSRSFQSVIEPLEGSGDGAIKLSIISKKKKDSGQISFDNYNSKFIGPYEAMVSYETSLTSQSRTSASYITSTPTGKLQDFVLRNDITLYPGLVFGADAGNTRAKLGGDLKQYNIETNINSLRMRLAKQLIRQRQQNLTAKLALEGRNLSGDILGDPQIRDHIREAILSLEYDGRYLGGYDYLSLKLTQGISSFGASKKGDAHLSRTKVNPNYEKLEINWSRFQNIGNSWMVVPSLEAQISSGHLYSVSRFGYGGQSFGRGFDPSEIVGDEGINGALEMRYMATPNISFLGQKARAVPYVYYDIGRVWSDNLNEKSQILSSIGEGVRIESSTGFSASFVAANPIENKGSSSEYYNHKDTRYLFQVAYKF